MVPIWGWLRALLSYKTQDFCSSNITSQNNTQKFLLSLSVLLEFKPAMKTDLHPLWKSTALVGDRVAIFSQQLSPSGSGVRCSQSPCRSPGPMCRAALDHSVPESGVQRGLCPSVKLCLQKWLPTMQGLSPC